jgi:Protein of unknown function (DUF1003)
MKIRGTHNRTLIPLRGKNRLFGAENAVGARRRQSSRFRRKHLFCDDPRLAFVHLDCGKQRCSALDSAIRSIPFFAAGYDRGRRGSVLSNFILMRQNRMTKRAERRDHLNLQVDRIAEKEITKLLQMVRAICGQMGLTHIVEDNELRKLGLAA